MNPKPDISKASPLSAMECVLLSAQFGNKKMKAAAAEAQKEFMALNAVAEAAELMTLRMESESGRFPTKEKIKRLRFIDRTRQALTTLDAIRKDK